MRQRLCTATVHLLFPTLCVLLASINLGCATVRVTDPARTATEQFLMTEASVRAIEQLSANALRDRTATPPAATEAKYPRI